MRSLTYLRILPQHSDDDVEMVLFLFISRHTVRSSQDPLFVDNRSSAYQLPISVEGYNSRPVLRLGIPSANDFIFVNGFFFDLMICKEGI